MQKFKTIFSLRVRLELRKMGIEPVMESDNPYKPGLKCWMYAETPDFQASLDAVLGEGRGND